MTEDRVYYCFDHAREYTETQLLCPDCERDYELMRQESEREDEE